MELQFKRDGRVLVGGHYVALIHKPKRRGLMGKPGVWNFAWGGAMRAGAGIRLIRKMGLEHFYDDAKLNDLKATIRKAFTASKMKKMAAHCDFIEDKRANTPPPTKEEQESLENLQNMLNGMLGQKL